MDLQWVQEAGAEEVILMLEMEALEEIKDLTPFLQMMRAILEAGIKLH